MTSCRESFMWTEGLSGWFVSACMVKPVCIKAMPWGTKIWTLNALWRSWEVKFCLWPREDRCQVVASCCFSEELQIHFANRPICKHYCMVGNFNRSSPGLLGPGVCFVKDGEVFFWDRARSHWSEALLHRPSTDWFFPGNPWAKYLPRKSFDLCNCEELQTNSSLPLSLSHSTYYYFVTKFQMFLLSCLINAFLMILQLLHIFWSYLILQMVFGVILHGAVWKIFFSSVPPLLMSNPESHSGPCMPAGKGWEKWDYSKKTAQKLLKAHGESCIDTIVYGMSLKFSFQCTRSSHDYRLPK